MRVISPGCFKTTEAFSGCLLTSDGGVRAGNRECMDSQKAKELDHEQPGEERDFVWRFRLDEKPSVPLNTDPLLELLRVQWEELLKLCIPVCGTTHVKIDGFVLMRDLDTVHPIFPDDARWDERS